jgi:HEAT repeat protein
MKNRIILVLVVVFVLISVGLFFYSRTDESLRIRYTWTQGAEQQYRLSISTDVRLLLPGSETPQTIVQQVAGTLNLKVFDRDENQIHVGFQLGSPSYTLNNQTDDLLQKQLEAPFVVAFDPLGRPLSFHFPEVLQKTERIILEESIRTFQVIFPEERSASWTTAEEHATGNYLAQYRLREDNRIEKIKTRYTDLAMSSEDDDPTGAAKAQIKNSLAVSRISPDIVWIQAAMVHESLTLFQGSGLSTESVMIAELKRVSTTPGLAEGDLFKAKEWEKMLLAYAPEVPVPDSQEADGKPASVAAQLTSKAQLAGLIEQLNIGEKKERIPLLNQIEKALQADPDLAYWLAEQIEQPGMTGATDAWLIHLLERSGTPQAQEALVMIMDDPYYRSWNRVRAIVALGGIENATDEAIASLVNISQNRDGVDTADMANAALMALGSIGKTLTGSDPERADLIREDLISTLEGARDFSETGMVLKAMENMGDPVLAETISPYLQDDAPFVRSAAARALGRLKGEENLERLTDQLEVEQNRVVRAAIIAGMEDNGGATLQSLQTVNAMVLTETEAGARFRMTKYLGDNLADFPEGKRTLQILALKDPSSRVRTHARSVLRQYKDME